MIADKIVKAIIKNIESQEATMANKMTDNWLRLSMDERITIKQNWEFLVEDVLRETLATIIKEAI